MNIIDALGMTVLSVLGDPKYWLYHVWDFVRVHTSLEEANEGVERYLTHRRPAEEVVRSERRHFGLDGDGNMIDGDDAEEDRTDESASVEGRDDEDEDNISDDSVQ